jgi:hypothetical protein
MAKKPAATLGDVLTLIGTQHVKELVQRVPKKLSGWFGLGIKIVYNSKKRGAGYRNTI